MNINSKVDEFLDKKGHPMTAEIQKVREIILKTDARMEETIKWSSPTFMYKGNMASFFMNAKKHVSLMFHKGALLEDPTGLLQGDGKEGRTAKFANMKEILEREADLKSVVKLWIKHQDENG